MNAASRHPSGRQAGVITFASQPAGSRLAFAGCAIPASCTAAPGGGPASQPAPTPRIAEFIPRSLALDSPDLLKLFFQTKARPPFPLLFLFPVITGSAKDEADRLRLHEHDGARQLSIIGDEDDDWRLSVSSDLETWSETSRVLLSGKGGDAPRLRLDEAPGGAPRFYRARKTDGLWDDQTVLRTVRLTFAESNWRSLLTANYSSGRNLTGTLDMGNLAHRDGVGVRYKGNTSYSRSGTKKSVNIEIDEAGGKPDPELTGFDTLNLNNAFEVMHRY